jgi:molybdate transport system substrate-binding protein
MQDKGKYWPVPLEAHPPLHQGGVILRRATDADAARQFRDFASGPVGRAVLNRYGFLLPGE